MRANTATVVRKIYICPEKFTAVGKHCYHFSQDESTWQDAHYSCLSVNSTLAAIKKSSQNVLMRRYLTKHANDLGKHERWIGGAYDWKQSRWVWGASGEVLKFNGFSRIPHKNLKKKLKWHCALMDPSRQNKWSAKSCLERKRYICQTPYTKVISRILQQQEYKANCDNPSLTPQERNYCLQLDLHPTPTGPQNLVIKPKAKVKDLVCLPHMILLGRKCYFFSTTKATWIDAHFACTDNQTKLAVIKTKWQDNVLRGFLSKDFVEKQERWIGGIFDSRQGLWKWAMKGEPVKYQNFDDPLSQSPNQTHSCIVLDPALSFRWNSKSGVEEKHYICQAKPQTVVKYEDGPVKEVPAELMKSLVLPDATIIIRTTEQSLLLDNDIVPYRRDQPKEQDSEGRYYY